MQPCNKEDEIIIGLVAIFVLSLGKLYDKIIKRDRQVGFK